MRSPEFKAVNDELVKYVKLRELLSAEEPDVQAVLDTLEGETDLHEALAEVADSALEDECQAEAVGLHIERLQSRKSRLETTASHKRNLIIMAMERSGLKTVKQPSVTISVSPTKPKLVINDEAKIPAKFWKPADPSLDKSALKEALDSGEVIEGARLSNGGVKLTLRVK